MQDYIKNDNVKEGNWKSDFKLIEIESTLDKKMQKAFFYNCKSNTRKPLIVSLHTWSAYYNQEDELAELCKSKDLNYIHPDFRGANMNTDACCSELALNDIDDAISYAINNANVDMENIYVIGVSGGGYATLSVFMKSRHRIRKFSAWASITNLIAWYHESCILKNRYAANILECTESIDGFLNEEKAKQKSPIFWETPTDKLLKSKVYIYAGIFDGLRGSVPITHSINFFNKVLSDSLVRNTSKYVSNKEKLHLLEHRTPLGNFGKISGRNICLKKEWNNIKLIVFEGDHEILTEFALIELLEEEK